MSVKLGKIKEMEATIKELQEQLTSIKEGVADDLCKLLNSGDYKLGEFNE